MWIQRFFLPQSSLVQARRYELDWLRVLVFGLLILFHIGMLYVEGWGFHVKSQYQSAFLANLMLLISPWRMVLLWFISGVAIRYILANVSLLRFVSYRSLRLLLPLLFAILVIIPPQLYYEMTFDGHLNIGYWSFLSEFFSLDSDIFSQYQAGIVPHVDVNHLWYLRELWLFSLLLIPLLPLLNTAVTQRAISWLTATPIVATILFIVVILTIQLVTDSGSDERRKWLGFSFLVGGYLLAAQQGFWQRLTDNLVRLVWCFVCCYVSLLLFYHVAWSAPQGSYPDWLLALGSLILSCNRVLGVLAVLALATKYLNQDSPMLAYLSEAVYPYYIVHQSVIVVAGYELSKLSLGPVVEPALIILITLGACFICFEMVRRSEWLRPLFGLKLRRAYSPRARQLLTIMSAMVIAPLALKILL